MLKALRGKHQGGYKAHQNNNRFLITDLKGQGAWCKVFQALKENIFPPSLLHPENVSFKIDGKMKRY